MLDSIDYASEISNTEIINNSIISLSEILGRLPSIVVEKLNNEKDLSAF